MGGDRLGVAKQGTDLRLWGERIREELDIFTLYERSCI